MAIQTFSINELRLMPTKSLDTLTTYFNNRKRELSKSLKSAQKKYDNLLGITTIDLGDADGVVATKLPTSLEGAVDKSKDLAGPMAAISTIANRSPSPPIRNLNRIGVQGNPTEAFTQLGSKLDDISSPILADSLAREQALQAQKAEALQKIASVENDIDTINEELEKIDSVIQDRVDGNIEEPQYDVEGLNSEELSEFIRGQIFNLSALRPDTTEEDPVFDLEFGPPISRSGQFILASDGLYYDSRSGGLPEVVGLIEVAKKWNFKYAPNLGGKGEFYTDKDLTQIADTIFDLDYINESDTFSKPYAHDVILQELRKDKVKVVNDLSGQINKYIESGESESGAVITNLRQSMLGIISSFASKEKRRKKQIEVALFFGIFSFKDGRFYKQDEEVKYIPVNDFSYLRDSGIAPSLEKQKKLILKTGEVKDSVLPITPKFLTTPINAVRSVDEVTLSFGGLGDFVKVEGNQLDSLKPFVKFIGEGLEEDILAGYNFLNPSAVVPSSTYKNMDNFAAGHSDLDGKLVASSPKDLYPSGLGIAYFYGLTGSNSSDPYGTSGKYSYGVISHEKSAKIHDLFYKADGITFDFWTYLPHLSGIQYTKYPQVTTSGHWYRLFFACENTGDSNQTEVSPDVNTLYQESRVLGYFCGIRHKLITDSTVSSIDLSAHDNVEFVFTTTIGTNTDGKDGNSWGHSVSVASATTGRHEFVVNVNQIASLSSMVSQFVHLSLRFDFKESSISLFADGQLVAASGIVDVFGVDRPKIPTFFTEDTLSTSSLKYLSGQGPDLTKQRLTPLVLGGGFTDLSPSGFLGANLDTITYESGTYQHGMWSNRGQFQRSGLNGFLGSFKIYDKAVSNTGILKNFNAQKAFFKSIELGN